MRRGSRVPRREWKGGGGDEEGLSPAPRREPGPESGARGAAGRGPPGRPAAGGTGSGRRAALPLPLPLPCPESRREWKWKGEGGGEEELSPAANGRVRVRVGRRRS